jgi:membrane associated rhomboid family serine protease
VADHRGQRRGVRAADDAAVGDTRDRSSPVFEQYIAALEQTVDDPNQVRQFIDDASAYDLFVFTHGFRPVAPSATDLLTSLFLHANFMHLFGNMLFLWIYGDNVEHRMGGGRYLLAYLATGIAATLVHWTTSPDSRCRRSARRGRSPACSASTSCGSRRTRSAS